MMNEKELIVNAQAGNIEAFSEIVQIYQGNVRACLVVRLKSRHEAEDLAQEAFVIAFKKLKDFDANRAFGPWVRSIALKLLQNYWRKHKPVMIGCAAELQSLVDNQVNSTYAESNEADTLAALKFCIKKLDEGLQGLLKQHYIEGTPVKEITKNLNIKHSAMTMKLHRMRDQLRKCINDNTGSCSL
jgi:RNA polymerase sigma-70 factor (ECF subfamily)